jgi:polysaccharide biosynthesis transport protein
LFIKTIIKGDTSVESLSLIKIFNILRKNTRIILLFSITGLVIGILYALILFKPMYQSTAKLLIRNPEQTSYVTEMGTVDNISPLTRDGNPTLSQMEILTSGKLANTVWQKISTKYKFQDSPNIGSELMQKSISVINPVGTDVIEITASWADPKTAKDIADEFVKAYTNYNINTAKKSIKQTQETIDKELASSEQNLALIRARLMQFRRANSTVNIDMESQNIVTQIGDLENRYQQAIASANSERNKVNAISSKLGINWQSAINSVALGHNTNIPALQTRLGQAQEQLAGLASKYAPTHPAMIALNAQINQIKSEMKEQIKQTIGNAVPASNSLIISDPVRTTMMEDLATSEANYRGYLAEGSALGSAIGYLDAKKAAIPNKQLVLSDLSQEELNWSQIVNTLKAKQLETTIRESGIVGNVSMIDVPVVPMFPAFPGRTAMAAMFTVLGMLLGVANVMIVYLLKNTYDGVDEIEDEFKLPVFGVIPWLDKETYSDPGALLAMDDSASYYSLAYQKVVSGMRIKGYNMGMKAFAFSSTEFSKSRSTILMNVAYGLNRAGKSVVVVDADFRTPTVHKEFGLKANEKFSLSELLMNITRETKENGDFNWKYLPYYLQELPESPNLFVVTNTGNVADPNEFLYSSAFNVLIQKLEEHYDWILFDTPPALAVSDAATISSYVDGAILITGIETTKSNLKKVYRQFSAHHIPIFGIIAREEQDKEAISSNEYIKQIISNMIPKDEDAVI